jgi:toxin CcdB
MPQFSAHANTNTATKSSYPYLLDVQSPLLETLETRLVIPLALRSLLDGKLIRNLTPVVTVRGDEYLVMTPQMAAISRKHLGPLMADCSAHRNDVVAAIDFLVTGF